MRVLSALTSHASASVAVLARGPKRAEMISEAELHTAACTGRLDLVRRACETWPDLVHIPDFSGVTLLWCAAENGHLEIVRYLCEAGAPLESDADYATGGRTPLYIAAEEGHLETVRYLCEAGAAKDKGDNYGTTPLWIAASYDRLPIVRYLCESGAAKDQTGDGIENQTPLWVAAASGHLEVVVRYLCEVGASKDKPNTNGATPLAIAASYGLVDVVRTLCEAGAGRDKQDKSGATPLLTAALYNHFDVVRCLCEKGAAKDLARPSGETALSAAATRGNLEVVRYLCEVGANMDTVIQGRIGSLAHAKTAEFLASIERRVIRQLCLCGSVDELPLTVQCCTLGGTEVGSTRSRRERQSGTCLTCSTLLLLSSSPVTFYKSFSQMALFCTTRILSGTCYLSLLTSTGNAERSGGDCESGAKRAARPGAKNPYKSCSKQTGKHGANNLCKLCSKMAGKMAPRRLRRCAPRWLPRRPRKSRGSPELSS